MKNLENVKIEGIDHNDSPDYVDAYIVYAEKDNIPLTEEELDEINEDSEIVHEYVMKELYG